MIRPAAMFVGLETTDGFLTMWAINHGFKEVNLLATPYAGSWLFPLFKIVLALLGVSLFIPVAKRFPRQVNTGFIAVSMFLMLVLASNFFEMFVHYVG